MRVTRSIIGNYFLIERIEVDEVHAVSALQLVCHKP